ncbi:hypothetical protein [Paenibacillus albus]|uniref:Lipoprotein n=1 Tax=Paenibacillus albus TaxID=2495582 RepID=A0A3Q8X9D5_9BACL|nr:hypothetical protein [Paenibacillus albus]AZN43441.1 hypothetical protein EJC50_29930 [Paenibacillus albus]
MKRIIGILFLCVIVLSGCIGRNNYYAGIEKKDIFDSKSTTNIEFVYMYKGHTDNWSAVYYVYKLKDNENHTSKMILKYIGEKPLPAEELSYKFDTVGGGGAGSLSTADSKDGIYNLGYSESNGSLASQDSIVKMQVNWSGVSEIIELKPS